MNIQKEDLGNCQVQLTIEVDAKRLQEQMRKSARKVAKEVRVPGFRPGKVPYNILVNYVGERALMEEAVEDLVPVVLEEAVKETETEIWRPDEIEPAIESLDPLTFRFVIPTPPKIQLGELSTLDVAEETATVEDEDVEEVLDELRESRADWIPVVGPSQYGDMVTLDLHGELVDGTVVTELEGFQGVLVKREAEEGEAESATSAILLPGQEANKEGEYPDLSARLVGMMVNQVKEFNLVYPADWQEEKLAGRTVLYRATLLDLKRKVLPELDDELARSIGDLEDLAELKERIRGNLLAEAEYAARNEYALEVLDALADASEIEYPPAMLRRQIEVLIAELEDRITELGSNMDDYLEAIGKSREELEDEYRDRAEQYLRRSLVLTQYIAEREIDVDQAELTRELAETVRPYGDRAEVLLQRFSADEEALMELHQRLMTRKALNKLVAEVSGRPEEPLFPPLVDEGDEDEDEDEWEAEDEIPEPDESEDVDAEAGETPDDTREPMTDAQEVANIGDEEAEALPRARAEDEAG